MRYKYKSVLLLAMVPLLSLGCDGPPNPTVPVTGVATFEGKPVKGANIDFVPQDAASGRPAAAITDENGEFEMSTYSPGDGVVPGIHKVTVHVSAPDSEKVIAGMPSKSPIPQRYMMPQTTPFEFEIKEGDEAKQIELKMTKEAQKSGA